MGLLIIAAGAVIVWLLWAGSQASPAASTQSTGGAMTSGNPQLDAIANAIYKFEGGGKQGATNSWNNNPGNIGGGQNTFPTSNQGWNALYNYISSNANTHPDWNFFDFFSHYLGNTPGDLTVTSQGDPAGYANYVANYVGADPSSRVSGFLQGA